MYFRLEEETSTQHQLRKKSFLFVCEKTERERVTMVFGITLLLTSVIFLVSFLVSHVFFFCFFFAVSKILFKILFV